MVSGMHEPILLTEQQVADRLGRSPGTIHNWRTAGQGPTWVTNPDTGTFLGYLSGDVDEWIERGRGRTGRTRVAL